MPIVIVAYSGGFGPTLSVLDRGGVRSRVRGLVLLDALHGADLPFLSAYTHHIQHTAPQRNATQRLPRTPTIRALQLAAVERPLAGDGDVFARGRRFAP